MTKSETKPAPSVKEMRTEYWRDYSQVKTHRFASKLADTSVVVLQPDVAAVFQCSDAAIDFLRSATLRLPTLRATSDVTIHVDISAFSAKYHA